MKTAARVLALLACLVLIGFALVGCGGLQRALQQAGNAESSAGKGQVTLPGPKGGQVNVATDENTSVKIPADFPSDVPVYAGTVRSVVKTPDGGWALNIVSTSPSSDAIAWYKTEIPKNGWKITSDFTNAQGGLVLGKKPTRTLTVVVSGDKVTGKTGVLIQTGPTK